MTFVKRIAGAAAVGATLLLGPITSSAQAGYVVTLAEVGSDVVATGSGPIDLTGLTMTMTVPLAGFIIPASGTILSGASFADIYSGFSGLTSFGSGGETVANNNSGSAVGVCFACDVSARHLLAVPAGYVSGDPLSASSTYLNHTLSSLGVTPGTYEWSWGPGENQNFTVLTSVAAVPEPASISLLGMALTGLLLAGAPRRAATQRPGTGRQDSADREGESAALEVENASIRVTLTPASELL